MTSGCGSSEKYLSDGKPIPQLDSEAEEQCDDPGVTQNGKVATIEHRVALAECERRRGLAVSAYKKVLLTFGVSSKTR